MGGRDGAHRQRSHLERGAQSRYEVGDADGGGTRYDYRTAHSRGCDTEYRVALPDTCQKCWEQAQEAKELGAETPTAPDEEYRFLT